MTAASRPPRPVRPFAVDLPLPQPVGRLVGAVVERALALDRLNAVYEAVVAEGGGDDDFVERAAAALGLRVDVDATAVARIPASGPLVVVANHPFGGAEGLLLAALVRRRRRDVRVLATDRLAGIPEMGELLLRVDVFAPGGRSHANVPALRAALRLLRAGGALVVFPSGTVSHVGLGRLRPADPRWNEHVAALARRTGAAVLPVRFDGANGPLFQVAGLVHPGLRTALLPRELLNKGARPLRARVGAPVPASRVATFATDAAATDHLRRCCDALAFGGGRSTAPVRGAPVVTPGDPARLLRELDALPRTRVLVEDANFAVVVFAASECPALLREIGREREVAFRDVGEGTGRPLDLDAFDSRYLQLLLWDRVRGRVAGGYRLARIDRILRDEGPGGLYLPTLFAVDDGFFTRLGPALELGRSFVVREYRRSFSPLTMLWKGIGTYVARHPEYRALVGPVSMSGRYGDLSRALVREWALRHAGSGVLAGHVRPRRPAHFGPGVLALARSIVADVPDLGELSELVSALEPDGSGVPVLVREYARLGGRFAAFNVDPGFADCLDGLVVIDLVRTRRRTLDRYLGSDGARRFLAVHAERVTVPEGAWAAASAAS